MRIVLGAVPGHIADPAAEKDPGAHADGPVVGIVEQRAQFAGAAVVGIAAMRLQHAHVGIDGLVGQVDRAVVVLVAVARIAEQGMAQVGQGQLFLAFLSA